MRTTNPAWAYLVEAFLVLWAGLTGSAQQACGQTTQLTVVELNVENLFDCRHDTLKQDEEFLPDAGRHWTRKKYWQKVNRLGQTLISCGEEPSGWVLPDLIGLCEVENDSVMRDLVRRSLLRNARYDYVMTDSPDVRGIDVALVYSPFTFRLIGWEPFRVEPLRDMRPTRDILYAKGELLSGDTLHVMVVHAPSRQGGERQTRRFRQLVADRIGAATDSILSRSPDALVLVLGDFNDYADDASVLSLESHGLQNVSRHARGSHGAKATYRYQGDWGSLDQMLVSRRLAALVTGCRIHDAPFLLEEDTKYGGVRPRRNYNGYRYNNGYSDHLPLVLKFQLPATSR